MEIIAIVKSHEVVEELGNIEKGVQEVNGLFREQLVSFGNYLLSPEREARIKNAAKRRKQPVKEARSEVYHADIENWIESKKKE